MLYKGNNTGQANKFDLVKELKLECPFSNNSTGITV